jgi:hypothetical protein
MSAHFIECLYEVCVKSVKGTYIINLDLVITIVVHADTELQKIPHRLRKSN